jgi:hypothetical protein
MLHECNEKQLGSNGIKLSNWAVQTGFEPAESVIGLCTHFTG